VFTDEIVDDTLGDVVSLYDPRRRRGVTLNLKASSGGYQSSGAIVAGQAERAIMWPTR
jgi:hypothetical protein